MVAIPPPPARRHLGFPLLGARRWELRHRQPPSPSHVRKPPPSVVIGGWPATAVEDAVVPTQLTYLPFIPGTVAVEMAAPPTLTQSTGRATCSSSHAMASVGGSRFMRLFPTAEMPVSSSPMSSTAGPASLPAVVAVRGSRLMRLFFSVGWDLAPALAPQKLPPWSVLANLLWWPSDNGPPRRRQPRRHPPGQRVQVPSRWRRPPRCPHPPPPYRPRAVVDDTAAAMYAALAWRHAVLTGRHLAWCHQRPQSRPPLRRQQPTR